MVARRLFFGALLIAMVGAVVWGDIALAGLAPGRLDLRCGSLIPLVVWVLAICGAREALRLTRAAGQQPFGALVLVSVAGLNGLAAFGPLLSRSTTPAGSTVLPALALSLLAIGCGQVLRRRTAGGLTDMACSLFIVGYMGLLPTFIIDIRASAAGPAGAWATVLFVAVVKITDIAAYFTGMAAGRTRLIPEISPAKTVEGLAGGVALAGLAAVVLNRMLPWDGSDGGGMGWGHSLAFGVVVAALGQMGDLVESVLKRDARAKDSANLIPAFGGFLDVLDSPVFAAPVGWWLLRAWLPCA